VSCVRQVRAGLWRVEIRSRASSAPAPIDAVAKGDVLVNVFHTSPSDPTSRGPAAVSVDLSRWAGRTVRLRLAGTDNRGPMRVGVDDIRFERIGTDADDRVELLAAVPTSSDSAPRAQLSFE
jgi:hypothetical protein